jgi:hypothetical protein
MRQSDAIRSPRTPAMSADRPRRPLAWVMGDIDMVRPLPAPMRRALKRFARPLGSIIPRQFG